MNPFFPIAEMPLYVKVQGETHQIPSKKLLYNADTNQPVSVVGQGYQAFPFEHTHRQITDFLDRNHYSYTTRHRLENGGRKLFSSYILEDEQFRFVPEGTNDVSKGRICVFNSYDSSTSFQIAWGLFRSICSNFNVFGGTAEVHERVWHTKSANPVAVVSRMLNNLDSFNQVKEFYKAMAEYELRQSEGLSLIDKLIPDNSERTIKKRIESRRNALGDDAVEGFDPKVPEPYGNAVGIRRKEKVLDLWNKPQHMLPDEEKPRNLWTLYNCFTNVATHETDNENVRNNLLFKIDKQFATVLKS